MKTIPLSVCCLVLGLLGWGEVEHWRASRRRLGSVVAESGTSEAVVVLGYRNRGERINAVNRWRVRAGLRSLDGDRACLVLSGGRSEAELMADYAREVGYSGPPVLAALGLRNLRRIAAQPTKA